MRTMQADVSEYMVTVCGEDAQVDMGQTTTPALQRISSVNANILSIGTVGSRSLSWRPRRRNPHT